MDLINRYVYAVTKDFDKKRREDIKMELISNIEDMIEQNQDLMSYEGKVKKALLELGDPEEIADNYRESKRYLIGPKYYDLYIFILKIVIGAVFGGVSIAIFIQSFFISSEKIATITVNYFSSIFYGIMQAFVWTTIAFMIVERKNVKIGKTLSEKSKWNLSDLPVVPNKKARISLSETIAGIIFTTIFYTIFISILYSAANVLSVYINRGGAIVTIPLFDIDILGKYKVLFIGMFILSISKEMLKLYSRRWMLKLSIPYIIITIIITVLALIVFSRSSIWNPNFAAEISKYNSFAFDFNSLWDNIKKWIVASIILVGAIDSIVALYKGIRYEVR